MTSNSKLLFWGVLFLPSVDSTLSCLLPSLSSAQVCPTFVHFPLHAYSLTALQSHLTSPWETTLFLKQGFRLMAIITNLLWKFTQRRTEQALCECILNKEVTPTPTLPPIKKERERSIELEGMRMDP